MKGEEGPAREGEETNKKKEIKLGEGKSKSGTKHHTTGGKREKMCEEKWIRERHRRRCYGGKEAEKWRKRVSRWKEMIKKKTKKRDAAGEAPPTAEPQTKQKAKHKQL